MPATLARTLPALALLLTLAGCQARQNATADAARPAPAAQATSTAQSAAGQVRVTEIARGLEHPWAVALLPDGDFLVTERPGRLRRVSADGAVSSPLAGVPAVYAEGQGGLLDVVLAPDFATSQRIYLSYAEPGPDGTAGTAVARATLTADGLRDLQVIYRQEPKLHGDLHFGSRIVFDGQGHVFISQGERNDRPTAQKLDMLQGKLVRLHLDGSVPQDNPFVGRKDARPEIWSYGHRNSQSLALDPRTGTLWEGEHGPRGGDELNLPQPGRNYGWPVITHGINYSGLKIPESVGTSAPGMEPPHHVWLKSPGLSGMAFLTGRPGHPWNDSLFLGALAERNLIRLTLDGNRIAGEERLLDELGERIRDVRVGPAGEVYVLTDAEDGRLLRLDPPQAR
ncbi:PQQ-dependent sugar dehydrogenase [Vulcaniibacterium gelatinicum]|uniref:PQQ-dependent sugar dehydrogenase n=1 Tax=Vulcaniibacterium gelatinicum TaxID=2598725 RepID=UPI0011C6F927|nr:PQQ-dependent sugar dehydrogenase [Vulcaniibacterium gelatinicum]